MVVREVPNLVLMSMSDSMLAFVTDSFVNTRLIIDECLAESSGWDVWFIGKLEC